MQSNGFDERFNQTLQRMLVKAITGQKELWDEFIDSAVFAYNTSYHESSCYASFEVMFGHKAALPINVDLKLVSPDKLLWQGEFLTTTHLNALCTIVLQLKMNLVTWQC